MRPADVIAIWARVRERLPDARLTVVGRGVGGEERELTGVPGIEVAGWVEPGSLPALFAGMQVAVVPWADTPSNRARHSAKVLELMAAGLPIVAYAVGELPVTLGEAGILVPPGDAAAFAQGRGRSAGGCGSRATIGGCGAASGARAVCVVRIWPMWRWRPMPRR